MIDVVLCELEGVVAETGIPRQRSLARALAAEGIRAAAATGAECPALPVRAAVIRQLEAAGARFDDTAVDLLTLRAERGFAAEAATGLTLAPGAREAIAALHASARLGLVTRARRDDVDRIVALASLDGAFEVVVTADDVIDQKPADEGYRAALARLTRRRPVRQALAIEDGLAGVRAARSAGLRCIVVGSPPAYAALEADAVIDGLSGHTLESLAALALGGARVA